VKATIDRLKRCIPLIGIGIFVYYISKGLNLPVPLFARLEGWANDFQVPFHDEKARTIFKLFLRRERPDWLLLNDDFQDFFEISTFELTPRTGKALIEEIKIGKKILKSFCKILPNAHYLNRREPRVPAEEIPDPPGAGALRRTSAVRA
jgi:hypothetical protein